MHPGSNQKQVAVINSQAIKDNTDWVGAYGDSNPVTVDTLGYNRVRFEYHIGATDIAIAEMGLFASDTATASGADDTDFTEQTDLAFSAVPSATDDGEVWVVDVDLRGRNPRRYWACGAKAGNGTAGTYLSVKAVLSEPSGITPTTATERGLGGLVAT